MRRSSRDRTSRARASTGSRIAPTANSAAACCGRCTRQRSGGPSPVLAYTWSRAQEALSQAAGLDPDPFDDTLLEYQNPLTGGPALPTIGTAIQTLRPGAKCKPHRHTGSVVYYVVRGQGTTVIDGQRFDWSKGDFLALPPWAVHAHQNRSDKADAVLFQVNDIPVLKSLGLYREEAA